MPGLGQWVPNVDLILAAGVVFQGAVAGCIGLDHPGVGWRVGAIRPVFGQDGHRGVQDGYVVTFWKRDRDRAAPFCIRADIGSPHLDIERLAGIIQRRWDVNRIDARIRSLGLSPLGRPQDQKDHQAECGTEYLDKLEVSWLHQSLGKELLSISLLLCSIVNKLAMYHLSVLNRQNQFLLID